MILRCVLDGMLLSAEPCARTNRLTLYDGDESFALESVEAIYYELVSASETEEWAVRRRYRLLRLADDFRCVSVK